jgi:hypothetical protein
MDQLVAVLLIIVVPTAILLDKGSSWFVEGAARHVAWTVLAIAAASGFLIVLGAFPGFVHSDRGVLLAVPLAQALMFLAGYKTFHLRLARKPIPFPQTQMWVAGTRHIRDLTFWMVLSLAMILGAVFVCVYFGIALPSRNGR